MVMSLSTQHLREQFKNKIDSLVFMLHQENPKENITLEIQKVSEHLEKTILEKTKLLEGDFHGHVLTGDYFRSVTESFDDLDRLLRSSKTFIDAMQGKTNGELLNDIKRHHTQTLIPLLNILSKLENDYISITTQSIAKKQELLHKLEIDLKSLRKEEKYLRNSFLVFNKKQKLDELINRIRFMDLKRQILKLNIQHNKLNLYYFNNDHPKELTEMKQKADQLRLELSKFKEVSYA